MSKNLIKPLVRLVHHTSLHRLGVIVRQKI
jgi:hypothetical protein